MTENKKKSTEEIVKELKEAEKRFEKATGAEWEALAERIHQINTEYNWFDMPFEENGRMGIKDALGKVIVPAKFDDYIETYTPFFRSGAMPMIINGKAVLVKTDGSGDVLPGTECDKIFLMPFSPYFALYKGDKFAIFASNGKMFVDFVCDNCTEFSNGLAVYTANGKEGAIYNNGAVLPAKFDEFGSPELDSFLCVRVGEEWGYVDKDDNFTTDEEEAFWSCSVF